MGVSFNLKSSFKCVREGEEDLWHMGPKMRGQKEKCSHKRSATCVCVPGITILSLFLSHLHCRARRITAVWFCILFVSSSSTKKEIKKDHKKKKNIVSSSFLVSDWATMKQQLGLWENFVCVKNNILLSLH
jgi:hypothetical protein